MMYAWPVVGVLLSGSAAAAENEWPEPMNDSRLDGLLLIDQLELARGLEEAELGLDMEGWIGGDYRRLRLRAEADTPLPMSGGDVEVQALYSRLIAPFWELQVGARLDADLDSGASRAHGALGIEGTAPYWFDVEATLFISQTGDLSMQLSGEHEQLFTQRLIGQARLDAELALQEVEDWGVQPGLSTVRLGYRLRYEVRRELAPYLGVSWTRALGEAASGSPGDLRGVGGLRVWW